MVSWPGMEKKFVANKALIVNAQGKILLLRDTGKGDHVNAKGKLGMPGGRMEHDETPLQGLYRELQEETGLTQEDIVVNEPFYVGRWGVGGDVINNPIIGIFYIVRPKGELSITLSEEHDEIVWIDPRQVLPDDTPSGIRDVIEAYRKHEGIVVAADPAIKGRKGYGLIQIYFGDGKGKTTAALGQAIRALGAGKKVGIVYFDKGGETHYSERKIIDQLEGLDYVATGRDRIDPKTGRFDFSIQNIDKTEAEHGLKEVTRMFQEGYDLVIMDEINSTTDLGMLSVDSVMTVLKDKPEKTELIMTGRNAPEEFQEHAHLMTEMRLRKHYFYSGVEAREGLDF